MNTHKEENIKESIEKKIYIADPNTFTDQSYYIQTLFLNLNTGLATIDEFTSLLLFAICAYRLKGFSLHYDEQYELIYDSDYLDTLQNICDKEEYKKSFGGENIKITDYIINIKSSYERQQKKLIISPRNFVDQQEYVKVLFLILSLENVDSVVNVYLSLFTFAFYTYIHGGLILEEDIYDMVIGCEYLNTLKNICRRKKEMFNNEDFNITNFIARTNTNTLDTTDKNNDRLKVINKMIVFPANKMVVFPSFFINQQEYFKILFLLLDFGYDSINACMSLTTFCIYVYFNNGILLEENMYNICSKYMNKLQDICDKEQEIFGICSKEGKIKDFKISDYIKKK